MIVFTQEMFAHKKTQYGTIQKPIKQSHVFVRITGDGELATSETEGRWKHAGYYMHALSVVVGLVDFPLELGETLAQALTEKLGKNVYWGDAPQSLPAEQPEEDFDDEFIGEAEGEDMSE